jgi:hypothetical protein
MTKRLAAVLLFAFFALSPVLQLRAQGPGMILQGEYGAGNRWVDVTERLHGLFRGNQLNFRVDNGTLGGDPAPGVPKVLRLAVRDADGRVRQLEFRENQSVLLGGYNFANDSRGLRILAAQYGAGNRMIDVTNRLNAQIQGDRLSIPVMNQNMGGDPAKGQSKALTVWYTFDGRSGQAIVNENDRLDLPGDAGYARDARNDQRNDDQRNDDRGNSNDRNDRGSGDDRGYADDRGRGGNRQDNRGYDQARMERVVLPPGTDIALRTEQRIDSREVVEGQTFPAEIAEDVRETDGSIAIPRGSEASLITQRLEGNGDITLDVQSIMVEGRRYRVSTEDQELQNRRDGVGANRRTGEYVGGGAALGAIIGAIAGGGKGAAIGAVAGAGAGAGTQIMTRGKEVHVPAETVIRFRLDRPLRLHLWN